MNHNKLKKTVWSAIAIIIVALFTVFFLFPIFWTLTTSIKHRSQIFQTPIVWFPTKVTWQYYQEIFTQSNVGRYFINSLLIAIMTVVGTQILGLTAAFGLSTFRFKGQKLISRSIITIRMIPALLFTIPYFVIFKNINLLDKLFGIAITHIAVNLPFAIWLFTNYFKETPKTIYEAALIDGCNHFSLFSKIAVKLVRPGVVTVAILVFISSWNEFSMALTLVFSDATKTLPIAISSMIQYNTDIPFGTLSAIGMVVMTPAILISVLAQRYIVKGITAGAVKG